MKKFTCTHREARAQGAIGIFYRVSVTVDAVDAVGAEAKFRAAYETRFGALEIKEVR